MSSNLTRRSFVTAAGAFTAASALPGMASGQRLRHLRYGYAAMTWGDNERQAIEDIAAVGYPGIQFRANAVKDFTVTELKDLLAKHNLGFVALSSGTISLEQPEGPQIEAHMVNAKFAKAAGAQYLQILDVLKGHPRTATPDECKRLGKMLNNLGKQTADIGLLLGYHNHLNTLSEMPGNLEQILDNSDPAYVKLELDTAHITAGGGDPGKEIRKYRDRLLFMHLKDVRPIPLKPGANYPFQFVELGKGTVDFAGTFAALDAINYKGWAVVELDREPDDSKTPKQSAQISKDFLVQKMGVKV